MVRESSACDTAHILRLSVTRNIPWYSLIEGSIAGGDADTGPLWTPSEDALTGLSPEHRRRVSANRRPTGEGWGSCRSQ